MMVEAAADAIYFMDGWEFWAFPFPGEDGERGYLVTEVDEILSDDPIADCRIRKSQVHWTLPNPPPWMCSRGNFRYEEGQEPALVGALLRAGAWWLTPGGREAYGCAPKVDA